MHNKITMIYGHKIQENTNVDNEKVLGAHMLLLQLKKFFRRTNDPLPKYSHEIVFYLR